MFGFFLPILLAAAGRSHARIDANFSNFRDYRAKGGRVFPLYVKLAHGRYSIAEIRNGLKGIRRGEEIYALDRRQTLFHKKIPFHAETEMVANARPDLQQALDLVTK